MEDAVVIVGSGIVEILINLYGDQNYEMAPALISGAMVGACSLVGGLVGGRFGLLVGKLKTINVLLIILLC